MIEKQALIERRSICRCSCLELGFLLDFRRMVRQLRVLHGLPGRFQLLWFSSSIHSDTGLGSICKWLTLASPYRSFSTVLPSRRFNLPRYILLDVQVFTLLSVDSGGNFNVFLRESVWVTKKRFSTSHGPQLTASLPHSAHTQSRLPCLPVASAQPLNPV